MTTPHGLYLRTGDFQRDGIDLYEKKKDGEGIPYVVLAALYPVLSNTGPGLAWVRAKILLGPEEMDKLLDIVESPEKWPSKPTTISCNGSTLTLKRDRIAEKGWHTDALRFEVVESRMEGDPRPPRRATTALNKASCIAVFDYIDRWMDVEEKPKNGKKVEKQNGTLRIEPDPVPEQATTG